MRRAAAALAGPVSAAQATARSAKRIRGSLPISSLASGEIVAIEPAR